MGINAFAGFIATLVLLVNYVRTAGELTMTFLPKSFGPDGFILGVNNTWYQAGFSTSSFSSAATNGYYVKGTNIIIRNSTVIANSYTMTDDTIRFTDPTSLSGKIDFSFETFKQGVLWDTSIEKGYGSFDFTATSYKYDIKFTADSNKRFIPNLSNFTCAFDSSSVPVPVGNVTDFTKTAFPLLRDPLIASMNSSYCAVISKYLQTSLTTYLTNAQTSQTISWVYGGFTASKALNFTPTNTSPFINNAFTIVASNSLASEYGKLFTLSSQIFYNT